MMMGHSPEPLIRIQLKVTMICQNIITEKQQIPTSEPSVIMFFDSTM